MAVGSLERDWAKKEQTLVGRRKTDRLRKAAAVWGKQPHRVRPAKQQLEKRDVTAREPWTVASRCQAGYSSFRQERGSAGCGLGVRSSRKLK